jgi:hypothetical protein
MPLLIDTPKPVRVSASWRDGTAKTAAHKTMMQVEKSAVAARRKLSKSDVEPKDIDHLRNVRESIDPPACDGKVLMRSDMI